MLDHAPWIICSTGSGIGVNRSGEVSHPLSIASLSPDPSAVAKLLAIVDRMRISAPILGKVKDRFEGAVYESFAVDESLSSSPTGCDAIPSKDFMRWSSGSDANTWQIPAANAQRSLMLIMLERSMAAYDVSQSAKGRGQEKLVDEQSVTNIGTKRRSTHHLVTRCQLLRYNVSAMSRKIP